MSLSLKFYVSGMLIIFIIVTGIWVSSLGRPINTGALTMHKLTALAFVVFTSVLVIGLLKEVQPNSIILGLLIIAGLSIIALFASGALLSINKPVPPMMLTIHAFTPIITIISLVMTFYILIRGR